MKLAKSVTLVWVILVHPLASYLPYKLLKLVPILLR